MKLKKWSWIGVLVLFVTMLVGCEGHESRGYLEQVAGKALSRVYPTKNIEDLFEQFPNGFTVNQTHQEGEVLVVVHLLGEEKVQPIKGTIFQVNAQTNEVMKSMNFLYVDGKFVFEDEEEANKLWPQRKFLFQEMQLNQEILAKAKLQKKTYTDKKESYNGENIFRLNYSIQLPAVSQILGEDESKPVEFFVGGYDESQKFYTEIGSNTEKIFFESIEENN